MNEPRQFTFYRWLSVAAVVLAVAAGAYYGGGI